jgi:hypothetical protein
VRQAAEKFSDCAPPATCCTFHAPAPVRLLINSLLSVLYTTRPTDSAETMLDETLEIFLHGLTT